MSTTPRLAVLAGFALSTLNSLPAAAAALQADIRWSAYGIPHIQASDERGLGYGIGYAYARDNACLLADEITTARGERSRYFGEQGRSSRGLANPTSDFFYTWLNDPAALQRLRQAQPAPIVALLDGYAAGFNRWLRDTAASGTRCAGQTWLHPIEPDDLLRLTRRLLVEAGAGQFAAALLAATPPEMAARSQPVEMQADEDFHRDHGSNALALGSQRAADSQSLLLANPHFPWNGALRFYQLHLRIPGRLDVMGAALPGLPLVNIGFNQHLAWTHTVDTSSHFTLYRLQVDPRHSRRYLVDGTAEALTPKILEIQVRDAAGQLHARRHTIYESRFGPVVSVPGKLPWTYSAAFALRDANLDNDRVLQQWYAMDQARSTDELRASIEHLQGIPWVNTLASDDRGQALYLNQSVVPNLSAAQLANCAIPAFKASGLPVLRGDSHDCDWQNDPAAAQAGIVPASQLPALARRDYVQNSNDSAWLTNPAAPLTGFSPLISRADVPLGPRARFALGRLAGDAPLQPEDLQRLVTDNHVYLADLLLPDLLTLCDDDELDHAGASACSALNNWDRSANLNSGDGLAYFQAIVTRLRGQDSVWRVPFDPAQPLQTPHGLALDRPEARQRVSQALQAAATEIAARGIGDDTEWGSLQVASRGQQRIGIPGGSGQAGIYDAIHAEWRGDHYEVLSGSSYIQLVRFARPDGGPQARGLLTFSQSSEPGSPHAADQTRLFSRQQWPELPYTDAQIDADPALERKHLEE
ncbi:MAG: Acyl-homoserine lactone acylase PvdQ [Pseudomonas citronellolis]|nr:MAG: Acyl-homoserine lactone acylase PvdQ [Pseudomonas citronellolis]